MAHTQNEGTTFGYYQSGILVAQIRFIDGEVWDQFIGWERGMAADVPFTLLTEEGSGYELPVLDLSKKLLEWNQLDWESQDVVFPPSGGHYQRHEPIDGMVGGGEKRAWIWAIRDAAQPIDLIICENEVIAFVLTGRGDSVVLAKTGFEDVTPLKLWQDPLLSKASYGVHRAGRHDVVMRDGIRLATEVWLPADLEAGQRVPTIFMRTPYGRMDAIFRRLPFVARGYALVMQDTRGREDSEGEWVPLVHERNDGDDSLTWIASQDWSDGNVGMLGGSYVGYVQWAAASSGNPHLKAIFSYVTVGTPYVDIPRKGGTILGGLSWIFMMAEKRRNVAALFRDDWSEVIKVRPIKEIPQKVLGKEIPFWTKWMEHPDGDEFWAMSDWKRHAELVKVPSLLVSGWYDDNGMGTSESWEVISRNLPEHSRMILGPWYHKANTTREIHHVPFGNNAIRYDLDVTQLRWFDRYLKGVENGVEQEPRVEYYMVGENQWKSSQTWPPAEATSTSLYLRSGGRANTSSGDGTLALSVPGDEPEDTYDFDPLDAAPYLLDLSENENSVPENYREVEMRKDVLVYTSEPLEEEVVIAGEISAVLYADSSARDTDWLVRLCDVDEEGNSIRLSDGIICARYRHSFEEPQLLVPGQVERYEIRMSKIANVFRKGHRIRVSVTSGAENFSFPNPNTGNDLATETETIVAHQRIYHNESYPSHIKLPVLKRG
ncbi:CocE/NonD family hydrolase [Brevibacillus choshinensis]|uniref:CocE/NonD family hydrolase n=1 Tax=Brevibacillus choshinensis TaxID=54911 RepID=A0ABX7FK79_BRECH|nr:CocE/NonD family hydrolase [Brevibacillus choshinensis]QRG66613.1 CocE/NonD family hydrolase [Brevibacillus choshinensis]